MQRHNAGLKFFAVFLMANFLLGITPTYVLHKWFANHTDQKKVVSKSPSNDKCLTIPGINCHCNSNVVNVPYLPGIANQFKTEPSQPTGFPPSFNEGIIVSTVIFHNLRAPPALG
ncbi:MAG: hypothetical protein J0H55_16710 [Chitinophagaceae bacterium]|nr:hypothetical protein [Chitinophagaceae bacterium]